jgi:hypothetical protein
VPPAATDPQSMVVMLVVQALLEYTPMFGAVVIVPDEVTFWVTVMAASVEDTSANPTMTKSIVNGFEAFANAISIYPTKIKRVLRLNKHYLLPTLIAELYITNTPQTHSHSAKTKPAEKTSCPKSPRNYTTHDPKKNMHAIIALRHLGSPRHHIQNRDCPAKIYWNQKNLPLH